MLTEVIPDKGLQAMFDAILSGPYSGVIGLLLLCVFITDLPPEYPAHINVIMASTHAL